MTMLNINVAREFSRYPAGRLISDGPFSGEAFRKMLLPILRAGDKVTVELDGVRGYGSSFLEEAFGGLVRSGFTPAQVKELVVLESKDESLKEEITDYIDHGTDPKEDE
jgi:STAS-like domain of unknown function (DUF4325)